MKVMKAISAVFFICLCGFGIIFLERIGVENPAYFGGFGYLIGSFHMTVYFDYEG